MECAVEIRGGNIESELVSVLRVVKGLGNGLVQIVAHVVCVPAGSLREVHQRRDGGGVQADNASRIYGVKGDIRLVERLDGVAIALGEIRVAERRRGVFFAGLFHHKLGWKSSRNPDDALTAGCR